MADNTIELVIKAIDQASSQIEGISDNVKGLGDTFKALGPILESVGAALSLRSFIDNIVASQAAAAQLSAALAATGAQARVSAADLNALTQQLFDNTSASRETIQAAESILLTFDRVRGDAFGETIQAAADLAARFGYDLPTATRLLGRALEEPAEALGSLQRIGVVLSDSQKDLIKQFVSVGDTAAAQDVILNKIKADFQGAAEAAKGTLGGALDDLKKSFSDLFSLNAQQTGGLISSVQQLKDSVADPQFKSSIQTLTAFFTNDLANGLQRFSTFAQDIKPLLPTSLIEQLVPSADPFKLVQQQIDEVTSKISLMQSEAAATHFVPQDSIDQLDALNKRLDELKSRQADLLNVHVQTNTAPVGGAGARGPDEEDVDTAIKTIQTIQQQVEGAMPEIYKAIDAGLQQLGFVTLDEFQKMWDQAVKDTDTASEQIQDKYAKLYAELDLLRQQGVASAEIEAREMSLIAQQSADEQADAAKVAMPSAQDLSKQFDEGMKQVTASTSDVLDKALGGTKWSEAQIQAVHNVQNVFSNLFDNMHEGVRGFLQDFLQAIQKIVANLAAADITTWLFGTNAKNGQTPSSGLLSGIISDIFHFASGGTVSRDGIVSVGENGPENVVLPQGARVYNQNQWAYSGMAGASQHLVYSPQYQINMTTKDADRDRAQMIAYVEWRSGQDKQEIYRNLQRNGLGIIR